MFGWFRRKPTCPVAPAARAWLESRTRWLVAEFGLAAARNAVMVLPLPEFFPDEYDGSRESGRLLFDRVCRYMRIEPGSVRLHFFDAHDSLSLLNRRFDRLEGALGVYYAGARSIRIDDRTLQDPLTLVAVAAHELSHFLLLGQGRVSRHEPDHEKITDLLTVYLGFGVFIGNARVAWQPAPPADTEGRSAEQLEYMGQAEVGYALALWARLRQETNPAWAASLCTDVRAYFTQSVAWLAAEGESGLDTMTGSPELSSNDETPPDFEKRKQWR